MEERIFKLFSIFLFFAIIVFITSLFGYTSLSLATVVIIILINKLIDDPHKKTFLISCALTLALAFFLYTTFQVEHQYSSDYSPKLFPDTIKSGEVSYIFWDIPSAKRVVLFDESNDEYYYFVSFRSQGSIPVSPSRSTIYNLRAYDIYDREILSAYLTLHVLVMEMNKSEPPSGLPPTFNFVPDPINESTLIIVSKLIAIAEKASGWILFNPPQEMILYDGYHIDARIATENTTKLIEGLVGESPPQFKAVESGVQSGLTYQVTLKGGCDFNISSERPERQILGEDPGIWLWYVTPLKEGNRTLILNVDVLLPYEDTLQPMCVNVTKWPVKVVVKKIGWLDRIKKFLTDLDWKWIISTLIAAGLLRWVNKRIKSIQKVILSDKDNVSKKRRIIIIFKPIIKLVSHLRSPSIGVLVNNFGSTLWIQGDLEGAKKCFERALKIDEKVYGSDHREVATDVNNLGRVLKDMDDPEGAKKNYERALKIFQESLGEDHKSTNIVRDNLDSLSR